MDTALCDMLGGGAGGTSAAPVIGTKRQRPLECYETPNGAEKDLQAPRTTSAAEHAQLRRLIDQVPEGPLSNVQLYDMFLDLVTRAMVDRLNEAKTASEAEAVKLQRLQSERKEAEQELAEVKNTCAEAERAAADEQRQLEAARAQTELAVEHERMAREAAEAAQAQAAALEAAIREQEAANAELAAKNEELRIDQAAAQQTLDSMQRRLADLGSDMYNPEALLRADNQRLRAELVAAQQALAALQQAAGGAGAAAGGAAGGGGDGSEEEDSSSSSEDSSSSSDEGSGSDGSASESEEEESEEGIGAEAEADDMGANGEQELHVGGGGEAAPRDPRPRRKSREYWLVVGHADEKGAPSPRAHTWDEELEILNSKFEEGNCRQLAERVLRRAKEADVRRDGIVADAKNVKFVSLKATCNFNPDKLRAIIEEEGTIPEQLRARPGLAALLEEKGGSTKQAANIRSVQAVGYSDGRSSDGRSGGGQGYVVVALVVERNGNEGGTWLSDAIYIQRKPKSSLEDKNYKDQRKQEAYDKVREGFWTWLAEQL